MKPNKLKRRRGGFTLVELMIVVAIIALLASIAVPGFLRARKRAQASRVINDLRHLDGAIDQYALENNKTGGSTMSFSDLRVYLKDGGTLYNTGNDILGNQYGPTFTVDYPPKVAPNTWAALSDVASTDYWSPYL
jgi:prepilin-type N-terminal cleavage/methylation domain-containing protein